MIAVPRYPLLVVAGLALLGVTFCAGRRSQASDDALTQSVKRTDTLRVQLAARVDTVRLVDRRIAAAAAKSEPLHDTVTVRATDTLAVRVAPDSVVLERVDPAIVRRIVADSVRIQAQDDGLRVRDRALADARSVIDQQAKTIKLETAAGRRAWWKPELVAGYGVTVSTEGRIIHGATVTVGWRIR